MDDMKVTDPADFGRVAVLMGGASAEREVSLNSGKAVLAALKETGIDVFAIDVGSDPVSALYRAEVDRVFNVVHGRGGEDGVLQGVLEALRIPYTGTGVLGSALSMDKLASKRIWAGEGLPTPRWRLIRNADELPEVASSLGFPMIIKPASEGSSVGMSKAESMDDLRAAYALACDYGQVFAEQWITGREFTAGFLGDQPLPLIRLETPNAFYDYEAKYLSDNTSYHCPCGLPPEQEQQLQQLGRQAAGLIGVDGWGRVDMMLDADDRPWLIEVNAVPGMTDHSLVPMAAAAAGINLQQLVWRILETSLVDR